MTEHADTTPESRPGLVAAGRHPVNIGHLVMGLAFLGLVGVWALVQGDVVTGDDIRWLLPIPWVLAGAAGLAATAVSSTRRHQQSRQHQQSHHEQRYVGWVPPQSTAPPEDDRG